MHSEFLVTASGDASVQIQLRFLHLLARQVARAVEDRFEAVPSLVVDGQLIEVGMKAWSARWSSM